MMRFDFRQNLFKDSACLSISLSRFIKLLSYPFKTILFEETVTFDLKKFAFFPYSEKHC